MTKIFEGKRLKLVHAPGFRLGIGYLPHYRSNKEIAPGRARQLILWAGPYFVTWSLPAPKNYVPQTLDDPERIEGLLQARRNLNDEIALAFRTKHRREQWQRESDAVKLRKMEEAENDKG
jgi:hypothetical protein